MLEAGSLMDHIVRSYNQKCLHRALGYLPPVECYRGSPATRFAERHRKLFQARALPPGAKTETASGHVDT